VGLPAGAANLVIAAVWVLIVAELLRYGLWAAIVAALIPVLVAAGMTDVPNSVERENKWRMGYMGFGLYNSDGFRVDPHDPDKTL
jgi:predicted membrane metal-binding protein